MAIVINGNGGTIKLPSWVVKVIIAAIFAILGFFLRDLHAQITTQGKEIVALAQKQAVKDSRYIEIKEQLSDIKVLIKSHVERP